MSPVAPRTRTRRDGQQQGTVPDSAVAAALAQTRAAAGAAKAAPAPAAATASTAAKTAAATAILAALGRFLDSRRADQRSYLTEHLAESHPALPIGEATQIVSEEDQRERAYAAKVRQRVAAAVQEALDIPDVVERQRAIQGILEREKRIATQREDAQAARARGAAEQRMLEASSPRGALWVLGDNVKEHTPDCFPGSVSVGGPQPIGAARRPYAGKLVEIVVASGQVLPVTPNHPILTRRGWVPAQHIRLGDELVCDSGHDRHHVRHPQHVDNVPATFAELFDALQHSPALTRMRDRVGPLHFHGDVTGESNVDVVGAYGDLRYGIRLAALMQPVEEGCLVCSDPAARSRATERQGLASTVAQLCSTPRSAAATGRLLQRQTPIRRQRGERQSHRVTTPTPGRDPRLEKAILERAAADASLVGQALDGFAGEVAFDQVVEIGRGWHDGYVFNSETDGGWYTANGIVVGNCVAMAGKTWPHSILRSYHPPLHAGCACRLLPAPEDKPSAPPDEALLGAMQTVHESEALGDDERAELGVVLEAAVRWWRGSARAGQFRSPTGDPAEGLLPSRPSQLWVPEAKDQRPTEDERPDGDAEAEVDGDEEDGETPSEGDGAADDQDEAPEVPEAPPDSESVEANDDATGGDEPEEQDAGEE